MKNDLLCLKTIYKFLFEWSSPLLLLTFVFSPKIFYSVRLGDLFILFFLVAFIPEWLSKKNIELFPEEKAGLLFLLWVSVVSFFSLIIGVNCGGGRMALTLGRFIEFGAVYALAATSNKNYSKTLLSAKISVLFLLLWALFEAFFGYFMDNYEYIRTFNEGFFEGEANHVAGAIAILANLSSILFLPGFIAVFFSGSRIALVGLLAGAIRIFCSEKSRIGLASLVIVVLVIIMAPSIWKARYMDSLQLASIYSGPHVDRFHSWKIAIEETPVLWGTGLGSRPSSVYESLYVMIYAETGIVGLILLIATFAVRFVRQQNINSVATALIVLSVLSLTMNTLIIARVSLPLAIILGTFRKN